MYTNNINLNVRRKDNISFTAAIDPYGFALLARKEKLTDRFIRDIRDLDYVERARQCKNYFFSKMNNNQTQLKMQKKTRVNKSKQTEEKKQDISKNKLRFWDRVL